LHIAAAENEIEIVTCLLTWGASVHARDRIGGTPLYDALKGRHWDLARLLVATGANAITADMRMFVCFFVWSVGWLVLVTDFFGLHSTAMHLIQFCAKNDTEALANWLACKADVNLVDALHNTALHGVLIGWICGFFLFTLFVYVHGRPVLAGILSACGCYWQPLEST
jgi:ankyrin repeat protein